MEEGQGRAQEGWLGGEWGQGVGRQAAVQDQGWSLQVVLGGQQEDCWAGLGWALGPGHGLGLALGLVLGLALGLAWELGAGPCESSAPAGCDHCH